MSARGKWPAALLAGASLFAQAANGWAVEPTVEVRFEVARGLTAHAHASQDGWIEIGTSRMPQAQRLQGASDEEGRSRLEHGDYNFDGYQDLVSRASMGQVNEAVVVHLYDPESGAFHELVAPSDPPASCEGFWSLSADAANRTLVSTCRSGPMWYSDIYRYEGKRLYLYRSMRLAYLETTALERALSLEVAEDAGPPAVWTTFDPSGKALERAIRDGLTLPPPGALRGDEAVVAASRLPLYTDPGDATTKRYLVEGDRVELLDENEGWLQLRYRNPSRGPVLGWVKLPEPP
ncbi:MAG: SH3 domain-containing protein [Lysobacteraceae bacterium]|nr:MAG: SH3 domain-containing protein [Xanthomonadaceae bacterium]